MESLDAERIGVQGDPERDLDSPSPALPGTLSLEGEGMDVRFMGSLLAEQIRVHGGHERDRSGRGGLSQHARVGFVDRILGAETSLR